MTKAQWVARYGQEHYDAHVARSAERLRAQYAAMSADERYVHNQRSRESAQAWREAHADELRAYNAKRILARYHTLSTQERREVYLKRKVARDAKKAADAAFKADALQKERTRINAWRADNVERARENARAWRAANPAKERVKKHQRRAAGKIPYKFVKFLLSQPCLDCGATDRKITVGHLIPVCKGGTNGVLNLVAQCWPCNGKQHHSIHPRAMMAHYPQAAAYAA